ncbi:MAG: glycosyl hydrolase 115 family protein [Prevotella sp.]|nr:glycosyl hydrolase 115 family protein [Prevotella sp.]
MKRLLWLLLLVPLCMQGRTFKVANATVSYDKTESPQVIRAISDLKRDIAMVTGSAGSGASQIIVGTYGSKTIKQLIAKGVLKDKDLRGRWESYVISITNEKQPRLVIAGSDKRGTIYGIYDVSQRIGVSPWYWWADVPVAQNPDAAVDGDYYASGEPSVKYRGIFINDEDWGLKPWAAKTFEKELGDIGPKTYAKVCELLLRLKANMLAPAMHSCTGAFYSHPESQQVADAYGIMITTSHCEPLLFNNAAESEWNKQRDGEWNYETNSATILKKLDDRIRDTKAFDNIYTMGLRGLHDEAMKGSTNPKDRARTLEQVFAKQREILEKYKEKKATQLPQIFVPYKETLDIYDAGLRVPDDITLVWPDDNYGYMKRVSNSREQQRSGGSGVYYHLSYCGVPHDNLWIFSTAPMLMYEELLKAYTAGADRYWLLNVGDIKPMEIETQMFMDMAYNFKQFSYDNANAYQAEWLAKVFGQQHQESFQYILDNYYRLAWDRKPEFMGYEMEWDTPEYARLYDTDFSFETGTAQKRLVDYQNICFAYDAIEQALAPEQRPALFEMLGYAVHSAYQMNRKFLYAQANHETGNVLYAEQCRDANRQINLLLERYNTQLGGKWNQMMSEVTPGYTALYHQMPTLTNRPTTAYRLPDNQRHPEFEHQINLGGLDVKAPFRLLTGMGTDWQVLQMGQPLDQKASGCINIPIPSLPASADSIQLCISVVPMWPVSTDRSNRLAVSIDQGKAITLENKFKEWGREWKKQILENRKDFVLTLPLDKARGQHVITLSIVDPGQIVQKITYQPVLKQ